MLPHDLVSLKVGEPHPYLRAPTAPGIEFLITTAGLEIRMAFDKPTREEIWAVKGSRVDMELLYAEDLIWLLIRFHPGVPWSEAPFTQFLVPQEHRAAPSALEGEERYLTTATLIDSQTAVVQAIRAITLTPELSWKLRDFYSRQAQTPAIDVRGYQARCQRMQERYSTEQLVALARQDQ